MPLKTRVRKNRKQTKNIRNKQKHQKYTKKSKGGMFRPPLPPVESSTNPLPPVESSTKGAPVTAHVSLFLDFTKEDISSLTTKMAVFEENNLLRMIVGIGDYIRPFKGIEMPNTKAYPNYDIYVIYTGYLAAEELNIQLNLDAIVNSDNPNRVICNIDLENTAQVKLFTEVFHHKINTIIHDDSKVALLPQDTVKLLNPEGEGKVVVPNNLMYSQYGIPYNTFYSFFPDFIRHPTNPIAFVLQGKMPNTYMKSWLPL